MSTIMIRDGARKTSDQNIYSVERIEIIMASRQNLSSRRNKRNKTNKTSDKLMRKAIFEPNERRAYTKRAKLNWCAERF